MDPGKSKASEFERRASMRNSRRISVQGGEREAVLDDGDSDFDFAAMAVSDGFRPRDSHRPQLPAQHSSSHSTQRAPSISSAASASTPDLRSSRSTSENARPSTSSESPEGAVTSQHTSSPPQRPSSIAKPPRPATDSISQRHDGAMGRIQEMATLSREPTGSSISEPYFGQETPYQGPPGPSHPYGMTGSVATTSTTAMGESSLAVSRGPAHPYGMYPQATVDESGVIPAAAIPVGFPGMPSQYQRRLGPDGEEIADIIGPDGHTEQLPPYTRYPDETYARKVRDAEQSAVSPSLAAGAAVVGPSLAVPRASIAGAGGLGLATRNPEFEPADDLDSPQSRHSSRSFGTDASHDVINTAAADVAMSEKQTPTKKWQAWGKRRLWGIVPYWAICLGVVVLVVMAVVLGAVVGTVLSKQHSYKKPPKKDGSSYQYGGAPTVTVTYDATPIPTPTDLPELVTGAFSLPLMTNRVSSTCFNDTTQSQAWNCNVLLFAGMIMNVHRNDGGGYSISVTCNQSLTLANNVYSYGEQPFLIPSPMPMELVNDTFQPARGPAWFRMMPFNKTVILPEPVLSATPASSAPTQVVARNNFNNAFGTGPGDFKRKGIAQTGDKPWVCTWPETFLEIFIYPQQNSSWNKVPASGTSGSWPSATPAPGSPTSSPTYGGNGAGGGGPTTTGPYMPIDTTGWELPPPPYPRVIKIEERRIDSSPMPSCRQVEITGDGEPAKPVKDANGNDVVIYIVENEPPPPGVPATSQSTRISNSAIEYRDTSDISDCGCMWYIT
ncbi:hypothetical protein CONLIGDRAFT_656944 [Coniochaeta ligniaria NRRL 30616]|uniref:DUF7820 domain-containing protein n=1 Tax=Coniochaeta ligniaria NRRL 30616 TaxID=1408157 RepID=A0A1J7ICZ6_9PEZI|nr:hypothetical protein CONLIGDRAFT_656944 [Coniochaeta ligniaria NRRL 30616]